MSTLVLSSHNVSHLTDCVLHCFNASNACFGFKFGSPPTHLPNCKLLKAIDVCDSKSRNKSWGGNWQFYKAIRDKPVS